MSNKPVPESLFHTLLLVIDYHTDPSGGTRSSWVLGTHGALPSAKAFARHSLSSLGYDPSDFATYEEAPLPGQGGEWTHGDGYVVYARAPAGQVFMVRIETTPNHERLRADPEAGDAPALPGGADHLHYVLQTRIDYNKDRSGAEQEVEVEGVYAKRADAVAAARKLLPKEDFAQYDERDEKDVSGAWEFGEDVVVHAVKEDGENFSIAVKTVPGAHKTHGKKQKKT